MAGDLAARAFCDAVTLAAGGTITVPGEEPILLAQAAIYSPACSPEPVQPIFISENLQEDDSSADITYSDFRDPFYASTFPQCYALAATTVVAYMLVIMLVITPRSFLDGGVQVLGRRAGFTNNLSSAASIGGRPWLQKVAALTVAISLTIASAETFQEAERQYSWGIENAKTIQREVLGGMLLKVIRLISSTFLWAAQAQTLIRLFPRQREKVIIMWTALGLISLSLIFDSVNSFLYSAVGNNKPKNFTQAIPALNYLFQMTLGLLYAAWVIYYAISKKRYAFYHIQMPNMILVALLSLIAVFVPTVFFVLDISKPDFAVWGDYVRWVGAAAASVVVWEWVERIEALEREDKKDGVLGREMLDTDDALDDHRSPRGGGKGDGDDGRPSIATRLKNMWPRKHRVGRQPSARTARQQGVRRPLSRNFMISSESNHRRQAAMWPLRDPPSVAPSIRTDSSNPSTVYYAYTAPYNPQLPRSSVPPPIVPVISPTASRTSRSARRPSPDRSSCHLGSNSFTQPPQQELITSHENRAPDARRRSVDAPPPADSHQLEQGESSAMRHAACRKNGKWKFTMRLEGYAAAKIDQWKAKIQNEPSTQDLPTVVIPPPPRPAIQEPAIQAELRAAHDIERPRWFADGHADRRPADAGLAYSLGEAQTLTPGTSEEARRALTAPPAPVAHGGGSSPAILRPSSTHQGSR